MNRDDGQEQFALALQTAELALQHAADVGKEIPRELAMPITDAKYAYKNSSLNANLEANFWDAFTKVRSTLGLGSLEGIGTQAAASARRMRIRYRRIGVFLLVILIPLSVVSLSGGGFITDIDDRITLVCSNKDSDLDCTQLSRKNKGDIDKFFIGTTTEQIFTELWWLNVFMLENSKGALVKIYYPPKGFRW